MITVSPRVAGLIGAKPESNPGGAKDAEMINFYLEVEQDLNMIIY